MVTASPVTSRIASLRSALAASVIGRDHEIDLLLVGLLSGEHVLLVGPPGCAKSMLAENLARAIAGRAFILPVMTSTTEDDIFGRFDVAHLNATGQWRRLQGAHLPGADVFLPDELWNGRGPCAHALLRALNERQWITPDGRLEPLDYRSCMATSNIWPTPDSHPDSGAAFDRFAIRAEIRPIPTALRRQLMFGNYKASQITAPILTVADIDNERAQVDAIQWDGATMDALDNIVGTLNQEGINPSDRRLVKAVKVAQAAAYLNGNLTVSVPDLEVLQHVLWDSPAKESRDKTAEVVMKIANPTGAELSSILADAEEIIPKLNGAVDGEFFANLTKLRECTARVAKLLPTGNGRAKKIHDLLSKTVQDVLLKTTGNV